MIRNLSQHLKIVFNCNRLLHPSISRTSILKRFESTDSNFDGLKKYRQAEVHIWHSAGEARCISPELITEEQWQYLYKTKAKHQRKRYCKYLLEKMKAKSEKKLWVQEQQGAKIGNREKILAERASNSHIVYGLGHNSLLLRVTNQTINKWINMKLHMAKMYGQKIIIDCSYENCMTHLEQSKVAKDLKRLYSQNRKHIKPLNLHLCNVKPNSDIIKKLSGQVPTLLSRSSPTGVHAECFTDMYPKERLVMMTPDSDRVLQYNFDDIYVIGGIVDLGRNDPLTLAKAKRLGLRTARLPLDDIRMGPGDKRELPMSSVAAFIRECQINRDMYEVIEKTVFLHSVESKKRKEKYNEILKEP